MKALLAKLWLLLSARCEHTTRVASDELDGEVDPVDRFAARLHEVVCPGCRHARSHFRLIDKALKQAGASAPRPGTGLSEASRERIRSALRASLTAPDPPAEES